MTRAIRWACLAFILAASTVSAAETESPKIEVVFVLDTTGSMSGLIKAAKEKVWAIANTLASTKPAPHIKMGLVAYRDRGDQYVTKLTDLTDDLDAVYTKLMEFKADGGGDGPESVNQALYEAVAKMTWSTDNKTYRVIFLVGDWPPHMDYKDDVKYPDTCQAAAKMGIIVNTVQCGNEKSTEPVWADIARRAEGQYFRVEQSGGAILAATPFDKELADLSKSLDETRIFFGSVKERDEQARREKVAEAIYHAAPAAAQAQRAAFNAGAAGERNFAGKNELVQAVADGQLKVADLKDDDLPDELRKLNAKDREKLVADNLTRRTDLQKKITDLAAKRQTHIEEQVKKNATEAKASLDHNLFKAIQKQAGEKGIDYEGGPKY